MSRTLRKNSLVIFERKVLREIYGPCEDKTLKNWGIHKNREIKDLCQSPKT